MTTELLDQNASSSSISQHSTSTLRLPASRAQNRCSYTSAGGYQCRSLGGLDHSTLCTRHALSVAHKASLATPHPSFGTAPAATLGRGTDTDAADVSAELLGPVEDFRTAAAVNHALGKLLILLAGNRISPRRGAVLAYTCQLLLQSVAAVDKEIWLTGNADDIRKEVRSVLHATSPLQND